jgi:hypothetical protein
VAARPVPPPESLVYRPVIAGPDGRLVTVGAVHMPDELLTREKPVFDRPERPLPRRDPAGLTRPVRATRPEVGWQQATSPRPGRRG